MFPSGHLGWSTYHERKTVGFSYDIEKYKNINKKDVSKENESKEFNLSMLYDNILSVSLDTQEKFQE